ncbi:hypothetical protein AB0M47_20980 [Hamadaea sp. NPDC051192]|uniref:hypothetical protein n=1 Tax=Hamadaea sp. NPDC051192 TaxID=3154940 RepID=UPI003419F13F
MVATMDAALPPMSAAWARVITFVVVVLLIQVLVEAGCDPYLAIGSTVAAAGTALRLVRGR